MEPKRVLVGITGGIAAYKVPYLIRLLKKSNVEVKALCTPWALRFVGDETLRTVTGHPVYRDGVSFQAIEHIRLAEWADLFLICPATANTIAKIAHGIADNLLTTTALSILPEKIMIAPAMNTAMLENAATRENIATLAGRGMTMLAVGEGELACSTIGSGRMLEVEEIAGFVMSNLGAADLFKGKRVLISSGPTEEPLDPVRVLSNRSSGKMGAALARAALNCGADVTVVSGPARAALPSAAKIIKVRTALEMRIAMKNEFTSADICIMAAAVSDFKPAQVKDSKIRRTEGHGLVVELEANPDILADLGRGKGNRLLIGFALETGEGADSAKQKMAEKKCDLMVLNRADESLDRDSTRITIFTPNGESESCPVMTKAQAADRIMKRIAAVAGLTGK